MGILCNPHPYFIEGPLWGVGDPEGASRLRQLFPSKEELLISI